MGDHRSQGIAEVTEQAYARRQMVEDEPRRRWPQIRTRIVVATIICLLIGSFVLYWLVNSIVENRRGTRNNDDDDRNKESLAYLHRLPNHVLPLEYRLKILPMLEDGNFTAIGEIQIELHCKTSTKRIRLHAHGLDIREITVWDLQSANRSKMIDEYVTIRPHFIDVNLMQFITAGGIYLLEASYVIPLNEKPIGLFRSRSIGINGTRWIAVSNFSPNYAHTAFPCFDEPWIKAPFRISIGRRAEMRSHSNSGLMATEKIDGMPGYVWDHYEKTLPMPTYVVAFMVTDFSSYDINVPDRPAHTIFARGQVVKSTEYVGYMIPRILRAIQNLVEFRYEADKLDVVAVPDLTYSAMENWGLITFREDYVAIDDRSTIDQKRSLTAVAAHEVAHQWFGNLVTPKSWSDVWLKEGFSSFFGYLALSIIEPSWPLERIFKHEFRDILEASAAETAHPLHIDLASVKRLDDVFDETSYVKGNCVVYMMYHFLGRPSFLSSAGRYIRTYYYRSADQQDVWNAFQEVLDSRKSFPPGLRFAAVMRTWTDQPGFPILLVKRIRETGAIQLTQDRFYNRGINTTSKELWCIPVTWTTERYRQFNNTLPNAWMIKKRMQINDTGLVQAILSRQWILFNINQTGLYRVNYDREGWQLLVNSFDKFPAVTRAQLLEDAFAIAKIGLLDYSVAWSLLENLETETDELLWSTAIAAIGSIEHGLWNSSVFKFVMCKLVSKVYISEVYSSALHANHNHWTRFKISLMETACSVGQKRCLANVRALAEKILNDNSYQSIPETYRTVIYCLYVKVSTEEQWLTLLKRYKDPMARDKNSLAYALGCHTNRTVLTGYLSGILTENDVQEPQRILALVSLIRNPYALNLSLSYFNEYWRRVNERTKELRDDIDYKDNPLVGVLHAFARYMDLEEHVKWLGQLKRAGTEDYDRIIDEVITRVEINVAWSKKRKSEAVRVLLGIFEKQGSSVDCAK